MVICCTICYFPEGQSGQVAAYQPAKQSEILPCCVCKQTPDAMLLQVLRKQDGPRQFVYYSKSATQQTASGTKSLCQEHWQHLKQPQQSEVSMLFPARSDTAFKAAFTGSVDEELVQQEQTKQLPEHIQQQQQQQQAELLPQQDLNLRHDLHAAVKLRLKQHQQQSKQSPPTQQFASPPPPPPVPRLPWAQDNRQMPSCQPSSAREQQPQRQQHQEQKASEHMQQQPLKPALPGWQFAAPPQPPPPPPLHRYASQKQRTTVAAQHHHTSQLQPAAVHQQALGSHSAADVPAVLPASQHAAGHGLAPMSDMHKLVAEAAAAAALRRQLQQSQSREQQLVGGTGPPQRVASTQADYPSALQVLPIHPMRIS